MASVGRPRAFGSDPPTGSGRARGSLHFIGIRARFRRFYKVILKLFMSCIAFSYKG